MNKSEIFCCFRSSASVSKSILTPGKAKEKIEDGEQVSIPTIAKVHDIDPVVVIDDDFTAFQDLHKNLSEINKTFHFGVSLIVCRDMQDKTPESLLTEHKINILIKNSEGYFDLLPLFNKASVEGFYYRPRIDTEHLKSFWTDNLKLVVPFFDSFLSNNSLVQGSNIVPDFLFDDTVFFIEEHDLPFNQPMVERVMDYCKKNKYQIQKTHSIYYYRKKDVEPLMVLKCIRKRTHMENPNLGCFSVDDFSFESFLERNQKEEKF